MRCLTPLSADRQRSAEPGVEQRLAGEEADHGAGCEGRDVRKSHLATGRSAPDEHRQRGERAEERPDEDRHGHIPPEPGAEERRELHVAHTEPGWIDEREDEEEPPCPECGEHPLDTRITGRLHNERGGERRQHDPVRDDPAFEIRDRHRHDHSAARARDDRLEGHAERRGARSREHDPDDDGGEAQSHATGFTAADADPLRGGRGDPSNG